MRLDEGRTLQSSQIDGQRMQLWVRHGKGGKDRGLPLPRPLLLQLRAYWKTDRPRSDSPHLFVRQDGTGPLDPSTLQKTMKAALADAAIAKAASIHSLRHYPDCRIIPRASSFRQTVSLSMAAR